jgi:polyhydroxybutyrate depolymerase
MVAPDMHSSALGSRGSTSARSGFAAAPFARVPAPVARVARVPLASLARLAALAALALGITACGGETFAPPPEPGELLEPGAHEIPLEVGAVERTYLVDIPEAARSGASLPVVLAFHGGGGHARQFRDSNGLLDVASAEGFILVHPQGTRVPSGLMASTWNAGFCCGTAAEVDADDVGFVEALLDDLAERTRIDPDRVYATGHSNGGMISYRLATEIPERFAAIAPVGGARRVENIPPRAALPLLHVHSLDDPRAHYLGGLGPPFPGTGYRVQHPPVATVLGEWLDRNGCPGDPAVVETRICADGTLGEGHRAERLRWGNCDSGAPVEHWRLEGPGHGWPGDEAGPIQQAFIGPPTDVIIAAEEVWRFFREHARRP